jgi:hypothetical protein
MICFLNTFVVFLCIVHVWILIFEPFIPPLPEGGGGYTVLPLSVLHNTAPSIGIIRATIYAANGKVGHIHRRMC